MGKVRRKFSFEDKQKIVTEINSGALTLAEASRKYQIASTTILYWLERKGKGKLAPGPSARERILEKQVGLLKETVGDLYTQIELLKKIESWKRRMQSADSSVITEKNLNQFVKRAGLWS